jgi:ABC-type bacteriocin/lantibiotic exporter with double-glycine peptidase domain
MILSALDFIFLALIVRFIQLLQQPFRDNNQITLFGQIDVTLNQIYIIVFTILVIKSTLSYFLQALTLEPFAQREAEVNASFVANSVFENIESSNSHNSADLLQAFTSLVRPLFYFLFQPVISFTKDLSSLIWLTIAIVYFSPKIALLVLPILIVLVLAIMFKAGRYQKKYSKLSLIHGREALRLFNEIKVGGIYLRLNDKEDEYLGKLYDEKYLSSRLGGIARNIQLIPGLAMELFLIISVGFIIFLQAESQNGDNILLTLGVFVAATFKAVPSLNGVINFYSAFQQYSPSLLAVEDLGARFNLLKSDLLFTANSPGSPKIEFGGDLVFDNLTYRYPNSSADLFTNFSLSIPKGSVVVLQGSSGSGKSTLVAIALGLLTPSKGQMMMKKNGNLELLGNNYSGVGYLGQEVPMLDESFGYNITLRPILNSDHQRLKDVLSLAGLWDRVSREPEGVNALIGENGSRLSVGERQRLGIARALFYSPKLIIFDEPTSNLDPISELHVWSSLQSLKGEVSMLIVSHREVPLDLYDLRINLKNRSSFNNE